MKTTAIKSEDKAVYDVKTQIIESEDAVINRALDIMFSRMQEPGELLDSPDLAKKYIFLELAEEPAEVFCVLFLNNRHRVVGFERMFKGTIDGASVHPREVVRSCITHNAAAVILAHNHPSGEDEPSRADITLTRRLVDSLALIDVRVLDHLVIGGHHDCTSFAERGLI